MGKVVAKKKPAAAALRTPKAHARKAAAVAYSLWTRPQSEWEHDDDELVIDVKTELQNLPKDKKLDEQVRPFRTKVRWATLTRSVN